MSNPVNLYCRVCEKFVDVDPSQQATEWRQGRAIFRDNQIVHDVYSERLSNLRRPPQAVETPVVIVEAPPAVAPYVDEAPVPLPDVIEDDYQLSDELPESVDEYIEQGDYEPPEELPRPEDWFPAFVTQTHPNSLLLQLVDTGDSLFVSWPPHLPQWRVPRSDPVSSG